MKDISKISPILYKLYQGDCLECKKEIPDESIGMI